jgi:hypothetical protein
MFGSILLSEVLTVVRGVVPCKKLKSQVIVD